jgi:NIPSNAP
LTSHAWSPIVELRQYTLHPGMRDVLIELFDREFVETQEALGMKVIGQFRVLDDPDRFIWLRGYPDMPTREAGLAAFYDGPVWKQHREQANATMIDSDNVLLLRPARPDSGFVFDRERPPLGSTEIPGGLFVATIYYLDPSDGDFAGFFDSAVAPALTAAGADIVAVFVSHTAPNNFPRLPVREGEHVLVYFATFPDELAYARHRDELEHTSQWDELEKELSRRLTSDPEIRKLRPSARSQLTAENALTR